VKGNFEVRFAMGRRRLMAGFGGWPDEYGPQTGDWLLAAAQARESDLGSRLGDEQGALKSGPLLIVDTRWFRLVLIPHLVDAAIAGALMDR